MEERFNLSGMVLLLVACIAVPAQEPAASERGSVFTGQTTNVLVPTLVRDAAGKVAYTLQADDFVLTDDGVRQKLTLQQ